MFWSLVAAQRKVILTFVYLFICLCVDSFRCAWIDVVVSRKKTGGIPLPPRIKQGLVSKKTIRPTVDPLGHWRFG